MQIGNELTPAQRAKEALKKQNKELSPEEIAQQEKDAALFRKKAMDGNITKPEE